MIATSLRLCAPVRFRYLKPFQSSVIEWLTFGTFLAGIIKANPFNEINVGHEGSPEWPGNFFIDFNLSRKVVGYKKAIRLGRGLRPS